MKNTNALLAENIQKYRKNREMTQEMLADELGVSTQAVSKWENGKSAPDIYLLPQLADCFGCSIDELFSRQSNSIPKQADLPKVSSLDEAIQLYETVLEDPCQNYQRFIALDEETADELADYLLAKGERLDLLFPQMSGKKIDGLVRECMEKGERIDCFLPFISHELLLQIIYRQE